MKKSTLVRSWFTEKKFFVSAGVNNALEARLAEASGYDLVKVSGAGTAAMCGLPDAGVTTLTEVLNNTRYVVNAVSVPVFVDCDTGFGNIHMVRRTVREMIQAGAAGMTLEDQADLRRCGYIAGKKVLPKKEAVGKYRAAVDIRNEFDPDFVLTARCDARGAAGSSLADAIARAKAYREAGMDVIHFEALQSMDEIKACIESVGSPIYFTMGAIPIDQRPSHEKMAEMGISYTSYWLLRPLRNYPRDRLTWEMLRDVRERGAEALVEWNEWAEKYPWKHSDPPHFHDFMGFPEIRETEKKYLPPEEEEKYRRSLGLYTPGEKPDVSKKFEWR